MNNIILKNLYSGVIMYLLVVGILFSINFFSDGYKKIQDKKQYAFYEEQTYKYWFEYYSVDPAKKKYSPGEDLEFYSYVNWKRITFVNWVDRLYCDINNNGEYSLYSEYKSGPRKKDVGDLGFNPNPGPWTYGNEFTRKTVPSICYLESQIIVSPYELKSHDISTRSQTFIGEKFIIE